MHVVCIYTAVGIRVRFIVGFAVFAALLFYSGFGCPRCGANEIPGGDFVSGAPIDRLRAQCCRRPSPVTGVAAISRHLTAEGKWQLARWLLVAMVVSAVRQAHLGTIKQRL